MSEYFLTTKLTILYFTVNQAVTTSFRITIFFVQLTLYFYFFLLCVFNSILVLCKISFSCSHSEHSLPFCSLGLFFRHSPPLYSYPKSGRFSCKYILLFLSIFYFNYFNKLLAVFIFLVLLISASVSLSHGKLFCVNFSN